MSIELTDIDPDTELKRAPVLPDFGVVLIRGDEWAAACPARAIKTSGTGLPEDLEHGVFWLVDLQYNEAYALQRSQVRPDAMVRSGDWIRTPLSEIVSEWALDEASIDVAADRVAAIVSRVVSLCIEATMASIPAAFEGVDINLEIKRSISLSNALRAIFTESKQVTMPEEPFIQSLMKEAIRFGGFMRKVGDTDTDGIRFSFGRSRWTHAEEILRIRVPSEGKWQRANIDTPRLTAEHLSELQGLGKPILVSATLRPLGDVEDEFVTSWTKSGGKTIQRPTYTLEEIAVIMNYFQVVNPVITVGPGWAPSLGTCILDGLLQVCENSSLAWLSYSAGLAAENIASAVFRMKGRSEASPLPEAVWCSAQDRLALRSVVSDLTDCGAMIEGGYIGQVRINAPKDPEILTILMNAAWELGLVAPMTKLKEVAALGGDIPTDPSIFGGAESGRTLAMLLQRGQRNSLWAVDSIVDLGAGSRAAGLEKLLS